MARAGLAALLLFVASHASAEAALPKPGDVIDHTNYRQYEALLSEGAIRWLRDGGFLGEDARVSIRVGETRPAPLPPRYLAASQRHSAGVALGADGDVTGWTAGLPFPAPTEPDLGAKIVWNHYYRWRGDDYVLDTYRTSQTDRLGNQRETRGVFQLLTIAGRTTRAEGEPTELGSNPRRLRWVSRLVFTHPNAARYQTTLSYRYLDPRRDDDVWVYLPSTRRVLRVQGGQRCSPVRGSDFTPDDFFAFDGRVFEQDWKVVGEGQTLAVMHQKHLPPKLDAHGAWPLDEDWELRDVWVVEGHPKDDRYCYGKRRMWIDKENFQVLHADVYDPQGVYWKGFLSSYAQRAAKSGQVGPTWGGTLATDFQSQHLTYVLPGAPEWGLGYELDGSDLTPNDFTPEALLRLGR